MWGRTCQIAFWLARFVILLIVLAIFIAAVYWTATSVKPGVSPWSTIGLSIVLLGIQRWVRCALTWFCFPEERAKLMPEKDPNTSTMRALIAAWGARRAEGKPPEQTTPPTLQ